MLGKLSSLQLKNFYWNDTAWNLYHASTTVENTGFIAQSVEQIFPELIATNADGYKTLNYACLGLYSSEAIKELNAKVDALMGGASLSLDANGKLVVSEIETQKLTAQQFCVGDTCVTETEFKALLQNAGLLGQTSTGSSTSDVLTSSTSDVTPPVITILGNNPATISVGSTYADPGVTITDNVDQNLGYTASLDGRPALSQGDGLSLDTSTTTTHTILYTATDSAGNSATAERIVNVVAAP